MEVISSFFSFLGWLITWVVIVLIVALTGITTVYVASRLAAVAWYRTKSDYERKKREEARAEEKLRSQLVDEAQLGSKE